MIEEQKIRWSYGLLKISAILIFFGRAWQFIFWDAPFRTFFWNENLLKPLIKAIGVDWHIFVNSPKLNLFIDYSILAVGFLFLLAAISLIFYTKIKKITKYIVITGGVLLVMLAGLLMSDRFYQFSQFFEYSIQFSVPFVLVYYYKKDTKSNS